MSNQIMKTIQDLIFISPWYHQLFNVTILVLNLPEQDTTPHKKGLKLPPHSHVIFLEYGSWYDLIQNCASPSINSWILTLHSSNRCQSLLGFNLALAFKHFNKVKR